MLGLDAREDIDLADHPAQRLVIECRQLEAGERSLSFPGDAELARDRQGGDRVIAGDHLDRDAGSMACLDGGDRFRARRIDHAYQADELQTAVRAALLERACRTGRKAGDGQNAQALSGHAASGALYFVAAQFDRQAGDVEHML